MGMWQNSSFLAEKCKKASNGHGEEVNMVLQVVFDDPKIF